MRRQQTTRNVEKPPTVEASTTLAEGAGGESEAEHRGRPGRRTVEERQQAVLDLVAGKATLDQIARRLGVLPATVEGWRQDALGGMSEALRRGSGKTARELELEREVRTLREVVTKTAIQKALLEQALDVEREKRPTGPARSRR